MLIEYYTSNTFADEGKRYKVLCKELDPQPPWFKSKGTDGAVFNPPHTLHTCNNKSNESTFKSLSIIGVRKIHSRNTRIQSL